MGKDIKLELSEDFGVDIMKLSSYLEGKKCNMAIITQIVKSGTSIGANIYESLYAESDTDFIHKLKISQKEASETRFWLKILYRSGYIDNNYYHTLLEKCESLIKILSAIIKSTKQNSIF
ncbi:MAG: four helix bundle protein [Muribaculaceae bacterium]|nr:four helix bundle protein [Muribaculaceae bacterium]